MTTTQELLLDLLVQKTGGNGPKRPILRLATHSQPEPRSLPHQEVCQLAEAKWPTVFNRKKPVPLVKGIDAILAADLNVTRASAGKFLFRWVRSDRYLRAIIAPDSARYSLDGSPVDAVTDAERDHARGVMAEKAQRREAKG